MEQVAVVEAFTQRDGQRTDDDEEAARREEYPFPKQPQAGLKERAPFLGLGAAGAERDGNARSRG